MLTQKEKRTCRVLISEYKKKLRQYRIIRVKDDEMNLRWMRIADFAGVTYGTSRKLQAADDTKASVSLCATLCGIALKNMRRTIPHCLPAILPQSMRTDFIAI